MHLQRPAIARVRLSGAGITQAVAQLANKTPPGLSRRRFLVRRTNTDQVPAMIDDTTNLPSPIDTHRDCVATLEKRDQLRNCDPDKAAASFATS
jgi:hypothetical protein